jgi:hypothetical protein
MVDRTEISIGSDCIRINDDPDMCHQALPIMRHGNLLAFPAQSLDVGTMLADQVGMVSIVMAKGTGALQLVLTPDGAREVVAGLERAIAGADRANTQLTATQLAATLSKGKPGT